jgi:hypothetical protein
VGCGEHDRRMGLQCSKMSSEPRNCAQFVQPNLQGQDRQKLLKRVGDSSV